MSLSSQIQISKNSSWIFLNEFKNIKQAFINNEFPNYIDDKEITHFINKTEQHSIENNLHKQPINLHNRKQFN